jgi:hypothetical protein
LRELFRGRNVRVREPGAALEGQMDEARYAWNKRVWGCESFNLNFFMDFFVSLRKVSRRPSSDPNNRSC